MHNIKAMRTVLASRQRFNRQIEVTHNGNSEVIVELLQPLPLLQQVGWVPALPETLFVSDAIRSVRRRIWLGREQARLAQLSKQWIVVSVVIECGRNNSLRMDPDLKEHVWRC